MTDAYVGGGSACATLFASGLIGAAMATATVAAAVAAAVKTRASSPNLEGDGARRRAATTFCIRQSPSADSWNGQAPQDNPLRLVLPRARALRNAPTSSR